MIPPEPDEPGSGSGGNTPASITLESVSGFTTLGRIGETLQLRVIDNNGNNYTNVTYTSSYQDVATVDQTGLVTAVGTGNCRISALDNNSNLQAYISITVEVAQSVGPIDTSTNELAQSIGLTIVNSNGDAITNFTELQAYNLGANVTANELLLPPSGKVIVSVVRVNSNGEELENDSGENLTTELPVRIYGVNYVNGVNGFKVILRNSFEEGHDIIATKTFTIDELGINREVSDLASGTLSLRLDGNTNYTLAVGSIKMLDTDVVTTDNKKIILNNDHVRYVISGPYLSLENNGIVRANSAGTDRITVSFDLGNYYESVSVDVVVTE